MTSPCNSRNWDGDVLGLRLPSIRWNHPGTEKLDRLGWSAGISLTIFGLRVGIRVSAPESLDSLVSCFPLGWKPAPPAMAERIYSVIGRGVAGPQKLGCRFNFLFVNGQQLVRTPNWEELCEALESDLDFYVARTTRTWLFVHAGVVGWKGRAVVIPGRSHSGKTTLVQALLETGATYYSDEFAVFDQEGRVHAFPRALSVRSNATATRIPAAQLGAQTGSISLPVGLVILTRYKPGVRLWPKVLSVGEGMLGLLQNTLAARRYPELAFTILERAICQAQVLGGTRGEALETARLIVRRLEQA